MLVSDLEQVKESFLADLNTIEPSSTVDFYNGAQTACQQVVNRARVLAQNLELTADSLTQLNQFCADRIARFTPPEDEVEAGLLEGYDRMKQAIIAGLT